MADKFHILAVEDEADLADNICEILNSDERFSAAPSNSASQALETIKKDSAGKIKLILLDIKMPGMDGLEFLGRLRADFGSRKIGVIMLTAWEDEEKWKRAREAGAAGYIKKPFSEKELTSSVERFFEGKELWMVEQTRKELLDREEQAREKKREAA